MAQLFRLIFQIFNNMKKILLAVIAVMSISVATFAQKGSTPKSKSNALKPKNYTKPVKVTPEQKAARNADSLKAAMNLTPEQYEQVKKINLEYIQKKDAVKAKYKEQAKQDSVKVKMEGKDKFSPMGQEIKKLNKERVEKIKAIVSEEQFKQWQAWRKSKSGAAKQKELKGNRQDYQKKSSEIKTKVHEKEEDFDDEEGL